MLVRDLLQYYTRNAPVTLAPEFTRDYEIFHYAKNVPERLRYKEVCHFSGTAMRSDDYGITIWYKP